MKLAVIRAAVIAGATDGRPNTDFPLPNSLVDHIIFSINAEVAREDADRRRSFITVEPWMLTRFECLTAVLDMTNCLGSDKCTDSRYYLDLTFNPMKLSNEAGLVNVWIQASMKRIEFVAPGLLSLAGSNPYPPSFNRPCYTKIGDRLWFFGGDRDFSRCKILIDAAVSGMDAEGLGDAIKCKGDIEVPIFGEEAVALVEGRAINRIKAILSGESLDMIEDGNIAVRKVLQNVLANR